jgi:hypothetical protein
MADKQALQNKLDELQESYSKTKYNKATNKYLGILRSKMAKIRKTLAEKKSRHGTGFAVRKSGDATVVFVGFPNAGKSSLLKRLTGVDSKVAAYAFTTLDVIPGMLNYNGANIQLLDLPGLIEGAHVGKGAGTMIASVIRIADLIMFVIDATEPEQIDSMMEELSSLNIRVNQEKPKVLVEEKSSGGMDIESNGHRIPDRKEVTAVLNEMGVFNAKVIFYSNIDADGLIALLLDNAVYVKGIVALNKTDLMDRARVEQLRKELQARLKTQVVAVSAVKGTNIDDLKETIFRNLGIIKVYLKPKEGAADFSKPFILRQGGSVMDVARGLHTKAAKNLKYAYVTGKSARFGNQKVGGEHVLQDGDILTLVYEKF